MICLVTLKVTTYRQLLILQLIYLIKLATLSHCKVAGPDPGRWNRCKCIGQKKIPDAFIAQIFTANNEKQLTFFAKTQDL